MPDIPKLRRYAASVKRVTGKPYLQQIREMVSLVAGGQHLGPSEYYELGVFDDAIYPGADKGKCVGWRASGRIDQRLNHDSWRATANDKLLNYALLAHYGFPIPKTLASYTPDGNHMGEEQTLSSVDELTHYLGHILAFPVFVKPIVGTYGRGTFRLESFDSETASFCDAQQHHIALHELVQICQTPQFHGMLFQECLQPHAEVRKLAGTTTSCVRAIVALTGEGPKVLLTFWKIARAHNITDNFCMGETGNLLAWLDKDLGTIERVVTGLWPDGREISTHPDTGRHLLGACLPQWQEAMTLCLTAASHFPGLKLQHWDIAFCDAGPVLMELNTEADLGVPQYLGRTPFMDQTVTRLMACAAAA